MNHLLKCVFCIHPATQRLCVPLTPEDIVTFDPEKAPMLADLLEEMSGRLTEDPVENGTLSVRTEEILDHYQSSTMLRYIKVFHDHVFNVLQEGKSL